MSCIKEMALLEPLVDTVPADSIVSTFAPMLVCVPTFLVPFGVPCQLAPAPQTIDIMKAKVEDLTFTAPFTIRFTRDDYCHALVAWFDVEFSFCHKSITLSTCAAT